LTGYKYTRMLTFAVYGPLACSHEGNKTMRTLSRTLAIVLTLALLVPVAGVFAQGGDEDEEVMLPAVKAKKESEQLCATVVLTFLPRK